MFAVVLVPSGQRFYNVRFEGRLPRFLSVCLVVFAVVLVCSDSSIQKCTFLRPLADLFKHLFASVCCRTLVFSVSDFQTSVSSAVCAQFFSVSWLAVAVVLVCSTPAIKHGHFKREMWTF